MGYVSFRECSFISRIPVFQPVPPLKNRLETPVSPGALGHLEPSFFEAPILDTELSEGLVGWNAARAGSFVYMC